MSAEPTKPYLVYSESVEHPEPNEEQIFTELTQAMGQITRTMAEHYRHAYRPVHAKSHAILKARMEVMPQLPPELAQGIFAERESYDAVMRFSTNPGDLLADNVSSPRGLAVKVMNVPGERLPTDVAQNQDFVCIDADVFPVAGPEAFLKQLKGLEKTLTAPEGVKHAVSLGARLVNEGLRAAHVHVGALDNIGYPSFHPLGETYTTVVPARFGTYVAKIAFTPASQSLKDLEGKHIDLGEGYNPLRDAFREFFASGTAVWDVQAQLALADEKHFPIEKADARWPPDQSPWRTVAKLTAAPQESYSDERQVFVDEQVNFNPWHAVTEHRPLGGLMRSRKRAYEDAQAYRSKRNAKERIEPKSSAEIPE